MPAIAQLVPLHFEIRLIRPGASALRRIKELIECLDINKFCRPGDEVLLRKSDTDIGTRITRIRGNPLYGPEEPRMVVEFGYQLGFDYTVASHALRRRRDFAGEVLQYVKDFLDGEKVQIQFYWIHVEAESP